MYCIASYLVYTVDGEDFNTETSEFEVVLGDFIRSQNISVTILQDELSELDETFMLTLDTISLLDVSTGQVFQPESEEDSERLQFTIREHVITIQDDDGT